MKKTASIKVKIPTESENYPSLTAPSCKEVHGLYGIQELHARPPIRLPACPLARPLAGPLTGPLTGRQMGIDTNYFQVTDYKLQSTNFLY